MCVCVKACLKSMCLVYLMHTHFSLSLPSFVSVSLWPFVRSSAGLINHTRGESGVDLWAAALGLGKAEIDIG